MASFNQHQYQGDCGQYASLNYLPQTTPYARAQPPPCQAYSHSTSYSQSQALQYEALPDKGLHHGIAKHEIGGDINPEDRQARRSCCLPHVNTGFRFGLYVAFSTVLLVLLINVCLTIVGSLKPSEMSANGFATLGSGTCAQIKKTNTWLHLLINVLSTLLLGASNYVMQCLSAPTRQEVDQAHQNRVWLDIGVPSIRNLNKISRSRWMLWLILLLSSLPLHLLYNGAVFATIGFQNRIYMAVVRPSYLMETPEYGVFNHISQQSAFDQAQRDSWRRLEARECKAIYGKSFVTDYGHVLMITQENQTADDQAGSHVTIFSHEPFSYPDPVDTIDSRWPIEYCLAKPSKPHCGLQFSTKVMIAVLVCNVTKALAMSLAIWAVKWEPLVTPGDAISSFLQRPDPLTAGRCLTSRNDYQTGDFTRSKSNAWASVLMSSYDPQRRLWFASASRKRWCTTYCLCFSALLVSLGLLIWGFRNSPDGVQKQLQIGFGEVSVGGLMMFRSQPSGFEQDAVSMMLLANTPQLILSILYYWYNGLFTCMLLADEWSGYSRERKALRVSSPKGLQRSTYRLQLPYRFGLPLICVAIILHWLVSQSLFLAFVLAYYENGDRATDADISTCGLSSRAIIATIVVSLFVLSIGLAFGFRRLKSGMPVVGSCSAAISAACHPTLQEEEPWMRKVMWGVVPTQTFYGEGQLLGHCSFSSNNVEVPVPGQQYA